MQSLALGYDKADRIAAMTNGIDPSQSESYNYDDQSRLTAAYGVANNESYGYDADGNRVMQTVNGATATFGISATSNRLMSVSGAVSQTYGYDPQGNLQTVDGATAFQYNPFNRLASASGANDYVDPQGQRLRKTNSTGTTHFAPEGASLLAESVNGTWVDYVWLNGRLIGRASGSAVYAVHDDQTGRPQVVTDANGAVAWKANNYPFDRAVTVDSIGGLNVGFPGQYYDAERGTWNNGYRDYSASLGRYIEGDPTGLMGGINAYVYVGGGPLKHVDPFGLTKWTVGMFSIGANFGYVRFQAISECVDGKQTVAEGNVGFFSLGAGLGFSGSTVTVDDGMPGNLDSSVFNGLYVAQGGNITLGFGVGYSGVRFGRAATDGHSWGTQGGLSEGASSDFGISHVSSSTTFDLH